MSDTNPTQENQESGPLAADPQDHTPRGKQSVPLFIRYLLAIAVLLAVVFVGFVLTLGATPSEDDRTDAPPVTDGAALSDLQASLQALEKRLPAIEAQQTRLDQLEQRLQAAESPGKALDVAALSERMDSLAATLDSARHRIDLQLTALAEGIETRIAEVEAVAEREAVSASSTSTASRRQPSTDTSSSARATPPSPPRLPLKISGVEYRGGKPFLSIAEGSVSHLRDVRLLGERESVGEWQLLRITGNTAEFRYRGQTITIQLP